jgi:hypothetical protein
MRILLQLLVFVCQYLYINYWMSDDDPFAKAGYGPDATTYRTQRGKKRVILFLSGGYCLEYHFYIRKTMRDLEKTYPSIMANYELICYEQPRKSTFTTIDDVCGYIRDLNADVGGIEELVLFGFSAGGVVASHIVSRLTDLSSCKKKIITYDTPYQVHMNADSFKHNWLYRVDFALFRKVYDVYLKYAEPHHLTDVWWNSGSPRMTKMVMDVEGWTFDKMYERTGFNFHLGADVSVYNIYSVNDPIVRWDLTRAYIGANDVRCSMKNVEKDTVGHCSDMAFSTNYLADIIECLF